MRNPRRVEGFHKPAISGSLKALRYTRAFRPRKSRRTPRTSIISFKYFRPLRNDHYISGSNCGNTVSKHHMVSSKSPGSFHQLLPISLVQTATYLVGTFSQFLFDSGMKTGWWWWWWSKLNEEIASKIGVPQLVKCELSAIHRLSSRPGQVPGVIVRFTSQETRD